VGKQYHVSLRSTFFKTGLQDFWIYRIFSLKQKLDFQDFSLQNAVQKLRETSYKNFVKPRGEKPVKPRGEKCAKKRCKISSKICKKLLFLSYLCFLN
jgi:hypothetical protein